MLMNIIDQDIFSIIDRIPIMYIIKVPGNWTTGLKKCVNMV